MTEQNPTLLKLFKRAVKRLFADEAVPLAGNIAFRSIFSFFPFLIFLTALGGVFGTAHQAEALVNYLLSIAPPQVIQPLAPEITSILTVPRTGLLSLAAVLTVWSAMSGVDSIRVGLNRAYDLKERRSAVWLYVLNVIFVIGAALILVAVSILLIIMPIVLAEAERFVPGSGQGFAALDYLRYPLAIVLLFGGLHVAHRVLPAKRLTARQVLPGVTLTVIVWIILTAVFSYWLQNFNSFASTYASLSGIFATMFFLYLAALVLILGGEVNRVLELHRSHSLPPESEDRAARYVS